MTKARFRPNDGKAARIDRNGQPCPSGKRIYETRQKARNAVAVAGSRDVRLFLYPCRYCRGFHLTRRADQGATRV